MEEYNKEHDFRIARTMIEKKKMGNCDFENLKLKKVKGKEYVIFRKKKIIIYIWI